MPVLNSKGEGLASASLGRLRHLGPCTEAAKTGFISGLKSA